MEGAPARRRGSFLPAVIRRGSSRTLPVRTSRSSLNPSSSSARKPVADHPDELTGGGIAGIAGPGPVPGRDSLAVGRWWHSTHRDGWRPTQETADAWIAAWKGVVPVKAVLCGHHEVVGNCPVGV